jgi:hypothetical protein
MAAKTLPTPFPLRLLGALAIDPVVYEEVEADRSATWQALLVVVLSSLSAGIGAFGWGTASLRGILFISGLALVSWATWAVITFEIGTRLMPETGTRADVGQLLRVIGFSATPGLLRIFGVVPGATLPAFVITAIWMLVAMVVGVRQALDYESTARAVAVCGLGWALSIGISVVLQMFFGSTVY